VAVVIDGALDRPQEPPLSLPQSIDPPKICLDGTDGRGNEEGNNDGGPDCDKMYKDEGSVCRAIAKRRGAGAGRRCWASAIARYAACKRGHPLPPLDTWNN
jgi:hypothetical protein